jgi:hypothetical protein
MTCEFCGRSQMNVGTYQVVEFKFEACTSCCREIDDLSRLFTEKLREAIKGIMKFPSNPKKEK